MDNRKMNIWFLAIFSALLIIYSLWLQQKSSPEKFTDDTLLDRTQKLIVETSYGNKSSTYLIGGIILLAIVLLFLRFEKL